jgi:hypothetical protein
MKGKLIWSVFWALVGVPVLIIVVLVSTRFPAWGQLVGGFAINFVPAVGLVFLGLGVTLIILSLKAAVGGMLQKFLLLTGASTVGLPVFGILHNAVSGLFNTEEAVFFIIAIVVCPIGFLVGIIGSIVLAIKRNRRLGSGQSNAPRDTP